MVNFEHEFLVIDIETSSLDIATGDIKVVGCYTPDDDKYYCFKHDHTKRDDVQELINKSRCIITFNGKKFDLPYMERYGYSFKYKLQIDLFEIFKHKRSTLIRFEGFKSYSMKNLIKDLKLDESGKGDIDYKVFQKEIWTDQESKDIIKYTKQDLLLTWKLWKFLENHFETFKDLVPESDQKRYNHIRSSAGSYAYSVICKAANLEPIYNQSAYSQNSYQGGYVSIPAKEFETGDIYCLDFNSAYPHADMMMNVFTSKDGSLPCKCCSDKELFTGNELFPIKGRYCSKKQGLMEQTLKKIYLRRIELKKTPLNIPLKIVINTMYGISAKPMFKWTYSAYVASDTTLFCRESLKLARKVFSENGYIVLYSDTDSVYLKDPFDDKEKMLQFRDQIIKTIKENVPFPEQTFDMGIDDEIKYMHFFKDKEGIFKKKNYLYITKDRRLKIKGLAIIKRNCSKLSVLIFNKYLKDDILKTCNCKFSEKFLFELISQEIENNIQIIGKQYAIKDASSYTSNTSIQYQIFEKYGKGEHILIPNYKLGAGKSSRYCTGEEAKQLKIEHLNLLNVFQELSPFAENSFKDYIEREEIKAKWAIKTPIDQTSMGDW